MNRDDIIRMAREAGIRDCTCNKTLGCLKRFAELVRADERDCIADEAKYEKWVGLTDDESLEAAGIDGADEWFWKAVDGIEAKLKEKNT